MRARIPIRTNLTVAGLALVVLALAACGPAVGARYSAAAAAPRSTPTVAQPAPVADAPTPAAPVVVPTTAPVTRAAPPPIQPMIHRGSFPLIPFGARGASGAVTVTADGMGFTVSVAAAGLPPGSAHSVHLHAGSCASAFFGRHLLILGTMVGNGTGGGALSTRVGLSYSTGHYVIVYANLSPAMIIGCADLGPI